MFLNKDQISETARSNFESQVSLYADFTAKALENLEKLVTLNLTASRASLEEAASATRQILGAKDPQEFMSLMAAQARPNIDKAVSYGGHLVNIAANMQTEMGKLAEAQVSRFGQRFNGIVEEAARNAPTGDNMAAFFKSAFDKANSNYEQFTRTARQASESFTGAAASAAPMAAQAASTVSSTVKA